MNGLLNGIVIVKFVLVMSDGEASRSGVFSPLTFDLFGDAKRSVLKNQSLKIGRVLGN